MNRAAKFAAKFTAVYLVIGILWVLFSNFFLKSVVNLESLEFFNNYKDWLYIFMAAVLIFFSIRYYFSRIQTSEEKYSEIFEDFPIGLYRRNLKGDLLDANQALIEMLGYPDKETALNTEIKDIYLDPEMFIAFNKRLQTEKKAKSFITQLKKFDGSLIWVEAHTSVIEKKSGAVFIEGGIIDIDARIELENNLTKEQQLSFSLMENSPIFFMIINSEGGLVRMNQSMLDALGYQWEEVANVKYIEKFIPESEWEDTRAVFEKTFNGNLIPSNTNHIITKTGEKLLVDWYGEEIRNEKNEIEMLYGYGVDITFRMQTEEELRTLSEVVRQSPDYILITDTNGSINYVNPAFEEITGYSSKDALGQNPRLLKSGHTLPETYRDIWNTITSGSTWKGELLNKKKNGDLFWEQATIAPTVDRSGKITSYVASKHDITERKAREKKIKLLNESLVQAYDATIEGWAKALELRDMETEGHSRRVENLTLQLAKKMGVKDTALKNIRRGALLHDIGKMAVPDRILQKPGKLTPEEWVIMKMHPVHAHKWLSEIVYLHFSIDIPYCHHEKWDGTGYPRGLKGEEIPLAARIFSIIDVYDALTSVRPYRDAWSREKSLAYIHEQSGIQFDPDVVEAFMGILTS